MTTPHQESGMWRQGDIDAATRWLASLDAADQLALRRSMQTQRTLAPIYNAVNRTIEIARRTGRSLSEGAQSLVSQTQQYGREAAAWADRTGTELRDRAEVTATAAAIGINDGLDRAGRAINSGVTATREAVTSTRDAVVSATRATGRAGVTAGKETAAFAGKVSRWFKEKVSNGVGRTSAGLEAMRQFKDPNLSGGPSPVTGTSGELSPNAINATAAQVHAFATAQSHADRQAALNSLVGSMDKDNQAMLMAALINSGQAPAAGAVNATPTQAPDGRGAQNQPGKGPELGK